MLTKREQLELTLLEGAKRGADGLREALLAAIAEGRTHDEIEEVLDELVAKDFIRLDRLH